MKYKIYADGGCRPKNNRCKDSYGYSAFVITDENKNIIHNESMELGNYSTNNIAEFNSFLILLKYINNHPDNYYNIYMDSQLVVNVINGKWKLKDKNLVSIYKEIQKYSLDNYKLEWIKRVDNLADGFTRT